MPEQKSVSVPGTAIRDDISEADKRVAVLAAIVASHTESIRLLRKMVKGLWLRLNESDGYAPDKELYDE